MAITFVRGRQSVSSAQTVFDDHWRLRGVQFLGP